MGFIDKFGFEGFRFCLRVSALNDWSDSYFCSNALLDNFDNSLPLEIVQKMQEFLNNLDDSDSHFFNLALKTLDH